MNYLDTYFKNVPSEDLMTRGYMSDEQLDAYFQLSPVATSAPGKASQPKPKAVSKSKPKAVSDGSRSSLKAPKGGSTVNIGDKHQTMPRDATNDPANDNASALKNAHVTPALLKAVQQGKTKSGNY